MSAGESGEPSTAAGIAAAVRSGATSARAAVEASLAAIEGREHEIHAFNLVLADEARVRADEIDAQRSAGEALGPLAGVPIALKDNLCTRGVPTTCSSKILEGWCPPYNATVVDRLVAAAGSPRHPRGVVWVPGGSSGGSAAAVAAGFAPVSLGSDTGGSIRQPASLCGVVGVKPTYGLVSRYGLVAFASSLDQIGPFARTVEDAALILDVIAGHDPRDSTSIPETPTLVTPTLGDGVEGVRFGLISELLGDGIAPDVRARVEQAAAALEAAGAKVGEVSVPAITYGLSAYYLIAPAEASSNLARYDGVRYGLRVDAATTGEMMELSRTAGFGAEVKRRIMLGTYALSAGYYDAYYGKALKVRTLIARDFAAAYEQYDLLLSPTSPTTAFAFGEKTADPLMMYLNDICTIPTNLVGHAAMSVPFGAGDNGLPVGVQVLAPALAEALMFRAGVALEEAAPTEGAS